MNKARAKDGIDKAADDDIGKLFDILRSNEFAENPDKAKEQFSNGAKKLNEDITAAKAMIDEIFPD